MADEPILPGSVWWCDGLALAFEYRFKRRPVLVIDLLSAEQVVVTPLSHRRYYGQETAVEHTGGVSFLCGQVAEVSPEALLEPLGSWAGFEPWRAHQCAPAPKPWWKALWEKLKYHNN